GICIACTMPGFPDKFMPFMDEPPGSKVSTTASTMYGTVIRTLRGFTTKTADEEPKWRKKGDELLTGFKKTWGPRTRAVPRAGREVGECHDDCRRHRLGGDGLGSDHPDRWQPGHLHQDRLQAAAGRRVPQHLVDLPRIQHLHEGQGPAGRALHHQPDLRHLR